MVKRGKNREYDVKYCICQDLEYHAGHEDYPPEWNMPSDSMRGLMTVATPKYFGFCWRCGTKVGIVKQNGVYRSYRQIRDDMDGKTFEDFVFKG